jgi:hypothetical protein
VIDQLYGAMPPVACKVCEYWVRALVVGSDEVMMTSGFGVIVTGGTVVGGNALGATRIVIVVEVTCAGLLLSVTAVVKVEVPLAVGTPEIAPVDGDRLNPAGMLPEMIVQV